MNGKYILDTSVVIRFLAGETGIVKKIETASGIFVPTIVIGELFYGAFNSAKPEINHKKIENFIREVNILECDLTTAFEYGRLKKYLKEKGTPIPENDIWIASVSFQYKIKLAHRDTHFDTIEGLEKERW